MFDEDSWYQELSELADKHGESVADREAWLEDGREGKSPAASFYGEYPEHHPT